MRAQARSQALVGTLTTSDASAHHPVEPYLTSDSRLRRLTQVIGDRSAMLVGIVERRHPRCRRFGDVRVSGWLLGAIGAVVAALAVTGGAVGGSTSPGPPQGRAISYAFEIGCPLLSGSHFGMPRRVATYNPSALIADLHMVAWAGQGPTFACARPIGWTGYAPLVGG